MATTAQKVEAVAAAAILGGLGALFVGPVGFAVGLAVGVGIDALLLHAKKAAGFESGPPAPGVVANAMIPGTASLPPAADRDAASKATLLMSLAASTGHTGEIAPAKFWLTKFQTSVGLPATGALDAASRAMLVLAAPSAANLPAKTVLG